MYYCSPSDLEVISTPEGVGFYDPATGDRWLWESAPSLAIIGMMSELRSPHAEKELMSVARAHFGAEAQTVVDALIEQEMLRPTTQRKRNISGMGWHEDGWADAARLHLHIQSLRNFDYSTPHGYRDDFKLMAENSTSERVPDKFKHYSQAPYVELSRDQSDIGKACMYAKSSSGDLSWNIDQLSDFLRLALGKTGTKKLAATGQHMTRTSPSGGARHPTEAYIFVAEVDGVRAGAYHYNVEKHGLELLRADFDVDDFIRRNIIVMAGRGPRRLAFSIVYTTIFERSMHRYREPRSYRVMHYDIGHLFGTSHLLLDSLDSPYFSGYAVSEAALCQIIGLPMYWETPMAHTTVGNRVSS
jgi:SagB-type dehydrogenase family enzyme